MDLVSKDSKGKIRVVSIKYEWDEESHSYIIYRSTGCYNGKMTQQPNKHIEKGKAKRTVSEQAVLEFNSLIKKYKDKGYKELLNSIDTYSEEELNKLIGEVKTRGEGILKPMLAKQSEKIPKSAFDKEYYGSRKVNGCRAMLYYKNGKIHTASRGAMNYDIALYHIIEHPILKEFFKNHPDTVLDGEIYKHGMSLQKISGICRTQSTVDDGKDLQFYWYDIVDLTKSFTERYKTMLEWGKELQLSDFDPYKSFSDSDLHIQLLPQEKVSGWDNMKKLHDAFVSEGWEGLVIRLADSVYKPGSRGNDWVKIKEYKDDTFKVIDYELGLRGSEDMVFICEMEDGRTFKAMPLGDRETKQEYVDNFENYRNQLGDCKYFELSEEGMPQQPKFLAFRADLT